MKKSLLLGSAAALVAVSGAQAADLPVVEPVDYVRVCDAFGSGFHYIPGTETCLKFSGRVRAEIGIQDDDDDDDNDDDVFMNSNFELVVNASSMTEIGMVVGQFAISGSNEGNVTLGDAWITIGENILVGRETSRFDFGGGYGIYDGLYTDESLNQFTFIMPLGNGLSMTLGLEDSRDRQARIQNLVFQRTGIDNAGASPSLGSGLPTVDDAIVTIRNANTNTRDSYGGMEIPDLVASLRISQGWGSAQVSGALHQIRALDRGVTTAGATAIAAATTTEFDDEFGFAVQAGIELNVGSMTKVKAVGGYADGALAYIGGSGFSEAIVNYTINNNNTFNTTADDTIAATSIDTNTGWYALGALEHDFGSGLTGSLTGSYHDFDDQAELWQVGATVEYEVVENLLLSIAGSYTSTEFDRSYLTTTSVTGGAGAEVVTEAAQANPDTDTWEAKLRVQRNF